MYQLKTLPAGSRHFPALDGLRGIAILMVVMHHLSIVWSTENSLEHGIRTVFDFGWSGVDLFFALSGFLITGILLDSRGHEGYFQRFYWRRAVRIFPIYYAFLALVFFVAPMFGAVRDLVRTLEPGWYMTYTQNWKGNHGASDPFLAHTWSLAVEEQFYLVWPLVVRFSSARVLACICFGLSLFAPAVRASMAVAGASPDAIYRLTICRIDALALGALMALVLRSERARTRVLTAAPALIAAAGIFVLATVLFGGTSRWEPRPMHVVGLTALGILFSLTVLWAASSNGRLHRVLNNQLLRSFGKYSYAMYMFHMVLNRITYEPTAKFLSPLPLPFIILGKLFYMAAMTAVLYLLARTSWIVFESRCNKLKDRFAFSETHPRAAGTQALNAVATKATA